MVPEVGSMPEVRNNHVKRWKAGGVLMFLIADRVTFVQLTITYMNPINSRSIAVTDTKLTRCRFKGKEKGCWLGSCLTHGL